MLNKILAVLFCSLVIIATTESHSLPMSKEMQAKVIEANKYSVLPVVWSYHIHCLFTNGNPVKVNASIALRNLFIQTFNLTQTKLCTSTFDDLRLCMFGK